MYSHSKVLQHTNTVFCMYDCLDKSPCIIYFSCDRGPRRSSKVEPDLFYFNDAWRCIAILSLESYCICLRCAITSTKKSLRNGYNIWGRVGTNFLWYRFPRNSFSVPNTKYLGEYFVLFNNNKTMLFLSTLIFYCSTYKIFIIQSNIVIQWFNTASPKKKLKTILVFYDHIIISANSLKLSINSKNFKNWIFICLNL